MSIDSNGVDEGTYNVHDFIGHSILEHPGLFCQNPLWDLRQMNQSLMVKVLYDLAKSFRLLRIQFAFGPFA